MGREVKRIALDFNWPLSEVWKGFRNPYHAHECPICGGCGYNSEVKSLERAWYAHDGGEPWYDKLTQDEVDALVADGRLGDFTHMFVEGKWVPREPATHPTADQVNEWARRPTGFGHDAINRWICIEVRAKRVGVWGTNGQCSFCDGNGDLFCEEKYRDLAEAWQPIEPPSGPGWQLWETVSEGSPTSPVFESPEALADWLSLNERQPAMTAEKWLDFIKGPGWAPSLIIDGTGVHYGVEMP